MASIARAVVHALHYARHRGALQMLRQIVATSVAGRARWYVVVGDFTPWLGARRVDPSLEIRPARPDDLSRLERLGRQHPDTFRRWLAPDHVFYVAVHDGEVIGYRALSTLVHHWVGRFFALRADQIYGVDIFVAPRFRRRGVTHDLMAVMNQLLAARGFREVVSIQRTDNVESIAMTTARSFHRAGTLTRTVFLGRVSFSFAPAAGVARDTSATTSAVRDPAVPSAR